MFSKLKESLNELINNLSESFIRFKLCFHPLVTSDSCPSLIFWFTFEQLFCIFELTIDLYSPGGGDIIVQGHIFR